MNKEFKREGFHNYLVISNEDKSNEFEINMLLNNKIKGLLPFELRCIDCEEYFYYEINSKQTLDLVLSKNMEFEKVRNILENIINTIDGIKQYLLNIDNLLLNIEDIYIDISTLEISLCYIPNYQKDVKKSLTSLVEFLMNSIDYSEQSFVIFIYGLYQIMQNENYDIIEVKNYILNNVKNQDRDINTTNLKENSIGENDNVENLINDDYEKNLDLEENVPIKKINVKKLKKNYNKNNNKKNKQEIIILGFITVIIILITIYFVLQFVFNNLENNEMNYLIVSVFFSLASVLYFIFKIIKLDKNNVKKIREDNIIHNYENDESYQEILSENKEIEEDEETTLLVDSNNIKNAFLRPFNNNEDVIDINKNMFIIGSYKENTDYSIDSKLVSRIHASIKKEENKYFITDLNSKNGTFLNNQSLIPNKKELLNNGDIIKISDRKYTFIDI